MTEPIVFGLDPGNSEATGVVASSGKGSVLTIPSDIGAGSLRELTRIRGGSGQQVRLDPGEYVLEVDGSSVFVGTLALEQSAHASTARGDVNRYWSGHTLRLLMVLAGTLIKEATFTVRVVTGLPVKVWDNEATVPQVQRSLRGTHQFVLNRQSRVMHVEGVMVVMEGAGALAVHGLAEDVPQAVIDIGSRTTELFWAQGQRPLLPRCTGFERGVGDVADALETWFLSQYGRELAPPELRNVLWSYAQRTPHRPIFVDAQPIQLTDAVARCVREVGEDLRSRISRAWRSSEHGKVAAEAARVLLIGGGAYYFAPLLREMLPHLEVPKHAEVANAQGYFAIGQQLPDRVWARLRPQEHAMARPRKAVPMRRIELRLATDDPMLHELAQEAQLRGVELTHHIHDLLRSRYLLRHGQSLQDLLWVPGSATTDTSAHTPAPEPEPAAAPSATAAAAAWADLLGMEAA